MLAIMGTTQFASHVNAAAKVPVVELQAREATEGVKPDAHWAVHARPPGMAVPSVHAPPLVMPLGAGQDCPTTHVNVNDEVPSQVRDATEGVNPEPHWGVHMEPRAIVVPL